VLEELDEERDIREKMEAGARGDLTRIARNADRKHSL
jgi:hypothetical protein